MRANLRILVLAAALAAGGLVKAQDGAQQRPDTGTSAISGVVTDALTGRPVSGAVVYVGITGRGAVGRVSRQFTDAKGRFVFTELPAHDQYFLNASGFGYVNGGFGAAPARPAPTRIRLAEGEWFKDAHIQLWPPAAVSGRVLDERGEPIVGVPVRVMAQILVGGRPQVAAGPGTVTDDRGAYRIAGLRPGRYFVQVPSVQSAVPAGVDPTAPSGSAIGAPAVPRAAMDMPGGFRYVLGDYATPPPPRPRPLVYPIAYHPAARTTSEAMPIELRDGDDRRSVDITLAPVRAATISGTVEGPPEALSELLLRLLPDAADDMGSGSEQATTLVDANGRFMFLNVPAGSYVIDARRSLTEFQLRATGAPTETVPRPPGFNFSGMSSASVGSGPPGTSLTTRRMRGAGSYWGHSPVAVDGQNVSGLTIQMRQGVTLTGRIVWEGHQGPPPDVTRAPSVWAEPADGHAALGMPGSTFGRNPADPFTIEGMLPGRYTLRAVFVQGGWQMKSIDWNGEDHTYTGFDASSGRDFAGVVITLTDKAPRLTGTLTRGTAEAAPGAVAIAFPIERDQWTGYGITPPRIRTAVADTAGAYRFSSLPAGEYFLVAVEEEETYGWQDPKFLEQAQARAIRIAIGWGEAKTQHLRVGRVR
jgi:hypothetical protein